MIVTWAAARSFIGRVGWQVWAILAGVLFAVYLDRRGEARGKQVEKLKAEKRAAEAAVRSTEKIDANTNDRIAEAERVRARPSDVVELPDGAARLPGYHYRDDPDGGSF